MLIKVTAVSTTQAVRTGTCLRKASVLRMVTVVSTTKAVRTATCIMTA